MGIGKEEILEMISDLEESIEYWRECMPHLDIKSIQTELAKLKEKVAAL